MPEFSACYFCGTALDAPLAEYPVIPDTLHPSPEAQRTVVLCPTCRRKLGAVVDAVVAAVDEPAEGDRIQQELAESTDTAAFTENDDADAGPETPTITDSIDEPGAEPADTAADESAGPAPESGAGSADESETADGPAATAGEQGEADEPSAADPAPESAADATDATEDDAQTDEPAMTALEYNKVMRLLQNRAFPVDREEFKTVATNAYQISDEEFAAVLDAAEQRGLIAVQGGQIVDG